MNSLTKIIASVLVLLAIVLGVVAVMLGRKPPEPVVASAVSPSAAPAAHSVVVANKLLPANQAIDAASLRLVKLPVVPTDGFDTISAVAGKIPRTAIEQGMPVTASTLANGVPMQLDAGQRGVAIPVDEVVGVANAIQPGDLVDVFFTLHQGHNNANRSETRLLLSKVKVLAYGANALGRPPIKASQNQNMGSADNGRIQARTAVLAVPVQDVNSLILSTQTGRLMLALRQPTDDGAPDPTLFPAPAPVLRPLPGLGAQRIAAAASPDNQAFSGVDLAGLSADGQSVTTASLERITRPPLIRHPPTKGGSFEIIRGTERQNAAF